MIFLTVGHELKFDRLVKTMDDWCGATGFSEVFGQVAKLDEQGYRPKNFEWKEFVDPQEFKSKFEQSKFVVSHAGMGTIITALTMNKPLVILPRKGILQETRNDHQIATANRFIQREGIFAAMEEVELGILLNTLIDSPPANSGAMASEYANPELISEVQNFIFAKNSDGMS
ncbi:MAG: glycosyltransferase [Sneathiella sp.]